MLFINMAPSYFAGATTCATFSGPARQKSLVQSLFFIHGLIRLGDEFAQRNAVLRIESRHTYAERELVTGFSGVRIPKSSFQTMEDHVLI